MKIAFVNFTYINDIRFVEQMIRGVNRLKSLYPSHEISISIYDDANNPAGDVFYGRDYYTQTEFYRGGNLNGLECIYGEADCFLDAYNRTGADWVIKIDSDTYPTSLNWLEGLDSSEVSCVYSDGEMIGTVKGFLYAISKNAASYIKNVLPTRHDIIKRINSGRGCEDMCILALARTSGHWKMLRDDESICFLPRVDSSLVDTADARSKFFETILPMQGITFKDWYKYQDESKEEKINSAIALMTEFADWAVDKPLPTK